MSMREKNRRAAEAQAEIARAQANFIVDGNARILLYFFRTGDETLLPASVTPADVKLAAAAVLEENYALAGFDPERLPGLRMIVTALGAPDIPSALEYLDGKRKGSGWARNDADGLLARLGLVAIR